MVQCRVDENFGGGGTSSGHIVNVTRRGGERNNVVQNTGREVVMVGVQGLGWCARDHSPELSSTLQISARRPAVSSPPGFVRMFAAPPASTQPSVRAVLPPVPAPPGVRIRMLAAPKRGAAVDSYQTVAVLCNAASSTRPGSRLRQPRWEPSHSQAALRTREECPRCMAADEEAAAALWHLPASRPSRSRQY